MSDVARLVSRHTAARLPSSHSYAEVRFFTASEGLLTAPEGM